ncbi:MAG: hypothetical protein H0W97_02065 [Actinobacteria bacterium]|nr:hypothetical protein [Actinomycetota bacterium]
MPPNEERRPREGAATTPAKKSRPSYPDLERLVAGILSGVGDDPVTPRAIREVDRIRSAAIAIIEADLPLVDEVALLARLMGVARKAEIPFLAAGGIIEEIRPDAPRPLNPAPFAMRARQLRRAGYGKCPVCVLDVIDEATLRAWEAEDAGWERDQTLVADRRARLRGDAA